MIDEAEIYRNYYCIIRALWRLALIDPIWRMDKLNSIHKEIYDYV